MSTGATVAIVVVGLLTAFIVPIRVAIAKQRRKVEAARARLVSAKLRRRADGVRIDIVQKIGRSAVHSSRTGTCALADDGFYCLGDDGSWGARVRFDADAPTIGDAMLSTAPCLVAGGVFVAAGSIADWLVPILVSMPPDGILLQLTGDRVWFVAVPDPAEWYALLMLAMRRLQ